MACPVCEESEIPFARIEGVQYSECLACHLIFADPGLLREIDAGRPLRVYDDGYWQEELPASRERSFGASLARVAEAILYSRIPIRKFVDIGTGPGYLLDALSLYLPSSRDKFFGVEAFPPPNPTNNGNYVVGYLKDAPHTFDGGVCIEVIEHLTPTMLRNLAKDISATSAPGALYLINTALDSYVRNDSSYLDPFRRGHIVSYSILALKLIFEPLGFKLREITGKSWAFTLEYLSSSQDEDVTQRIWSPLPSNKAMLHDPQMGSLMYVLGLETVRAYQ